MLYLVDVTGITASVSPLKNQSAKLVNNIKQRTSIMVLHMKHEVGMKIKDTICCRTSHFFLLFYFILIYFPSTWFQIIEWGYIFIPSSSSCY